MLSSDFFEPVLKRSGRRGPFGNWNAVKNANRVLKGAIRPKQWMPMLGISASLLLASCEDSPQAPAQPVLGRVNFGKTVPIGAQVILHPVGHQLPENIVPMGNVGPDGAFNVGSYGIDDGAPVGKYKATIQWFKVVGNPGGAGRGPNVMPSRYADPAKTPLVVTVSEGRNELPPFDVVR